MGALQSVACRRCWVNGECVVQTRQIWGRTEYGLAEFESPSCFDGVCVEHTRQLWKLKVQVCTGVTRLGDGTVVVQGLLEIKDTHRP